MGSAVSSSGVVRGADQHRFWAVAALAAAAGAALVLAFRADGWALAYDMDGGALGLAVAPWLALALSAGAALVGLLLSPAIGTRARRVLRVGVVLVTAWSVALLPIDLLRAVRLIPLGLSGWGAGLRVLLVVGAAGALVASRPVVRRGRCPECGRRPPSAAARLPMWPAWVALAFALPYPLLRTVWALGGSFGTLAGPLVMSPALAWGVVVAGSLLVAFTVVLVVDRGPAWLRWPLGLGGVAVGGALGVLGAQASLGVWGRVITDGTAAVVTSDAELVWWVFAIVYGSWFVGGLAVAVASARYWARRRGCRACLVVREMEPVLAA